MLSIGIRQHVQSVRVCADCPGHAIPHLSHAFWKGVLPQPEEVRSTHGDLKLSTKMNREKKGNDNDDDLCFKPNQNHRFTTLLTPIYANFFVMSDCVLSATVIPQR